MKAVELRDLDVETLRAKTQEIDDQLFRMRIQKSMGQLEAPGKMKSIRRERARILTVLKEKAK
jgi:large subunit ribosomal protein L29